MFVVGDRIQQKKNAFGRVWIVVDAYGNLPRSATPPKKRHNYSCCARNVGRQNKSRICVRKRLQESWIVMELDIPPFEQSYDDHKRFAQDIVNAMSNRLKPKWFAQYPLWYEDDLPNLVRALREHVVITGGILSTAQWACSDKYLDYGYYFVTVEFYKYV